MLPLSGGKLPGEGQLLFCTQAACEEKQNYQQEGSLNRGELFHPIKTDVWGQNGILLYQWTDMPNKNCHLL